VRAQWHGLGIKLGAAGILSPADVPFLIAFVVWFEVENEAIFA
jgi:hypothetical protein